MPLSRPYTEQDVQNAELLLAGRARSDFNREVRARCKVLLGLIELLDEKDSDWRQKVADSVNDALAKGKLPEDFNPDFPFTLEGTDFEHLATIGIGASDAGTIVKRKRQANKGGTPKG